MEEQHIKNNEFMLDFVLTDNQSGSLGEIKPIGILDIFQSVAGAHAEILGVSTDHLMKNNKCWVLESVRYKMIKSIPSHATVCAKTSFLKPGKLIYDRDYEITDMSGNRLIIGSSRWFVIDFSTRKPAVKSVDYGCEGKLQSIMEEHSRIRFNFDDANTLGEYIVRLSDTDIVGHMNNSRYADLIFEFYPKLLSELQIDFIKECLQGEHITVRGTADDEYTYIEGSVNGERRFVAKLKF